MIKVQTATLLKETGRMALTIGNFTTKSHYLIFATKIPEIGGTVKNINLISSPVVKTTN